MVSKKLLPLMRNETSVPHIPIAITIMTIPMFQMAILPSFLKSLASRG